MRNAGGTVTVHLTVAKDSWHDPAGTVVPPRKCYEFMLIKVLNIYAHYIDHPNRWSTPHSPSRTISPVGCRSRVQIVGSAFGSLTGLGGFKWKWKAESVAKQEQKRTPRKTNRFATAATNTSPRADTR